MKLISILAAAGQLTLLSSTTLAAPVDSPAPKRLGNGAVLDDDFPDPSIVQGEDGITWYAFATASGGKQVQVAKGESLYGPWELLDTDALPASPSWATGENTWAPDVRRALDGTYVMYFSGEVASSPNFHCIGTASSDNILGPYEPDDEPFACDLGVGGAIDASGFEDVDGKSYVLYKIDGNSIGNGGSCGNAVEPLVPTPIKLQQVEKNGVTKIGNATTILDRIDTDGPLVEAPSVMRSSDGKYILFFSSGCFTEPTYKVDYAVADTLSGPYRRAQRPIVVTGEFALMAPGGATALLATMPDEDEDDVMPSIAFHADCDEGRCMYTSQLTVDGDVFALVM